MPSIKHKDSWLNRHYSYTSASAICARFSNMYQNVINLCEPLLHRRRYTHVHSRTDPLHLPSSKQSSQCLCRPNVKTTNEKLPAKFKSLQLSIKTECQSLQQPHERMNTLNTKTGNIVMLKVLAFF